MASPLKRAFQAAEIIADKLDIGVEIFEYLKERNLNGILTGMKKGKAKKKYPDQVRKHQNYKYVDGSERAEDFNNRVKSAINFLLEMKYNSLITVTHGLFMKTFFEEMIDVNIMRVGDGGFVLVEEKNGKFEVLKEDGIEYK